MVKTLMLMYYRKINTFIASHYFLEYNFTMYLFFVFSFLKYMHVNSHKDLP